MAVDDSQNYEICSKCSTSKSISQFYRSPGMRDGHRNECMECTRASRRKHYVQNRDIYIRRRKTGSAATQIDIGN